MSKTIQEQIEVMTHFMNGGEVECINKSMENDEYDGMSNPRWDWASCDYRIKEEKKTVTIEKWLLTNGDRYDEVKTSNIENYLDSCINWKKVKLLDTYKVEL